MIKVFLVYNDNIKEYIEEFDTYQNVNFTFINERSKKDKKKAYNLKLEWGAKKSPFALITENAKAIKAFYSEADDVLKELITFLNSYES